MTKEQEIQKNMLDLKISRAEAEELYAYDHEEIENAEADALTAKAKQIKRYEQSMTPRKKTEKAIEQKAEITAVLNEQKFSFTYGGNNYTVMLTKHRPPKK